MKIKNKLKILEICPYSAGGCGVWARVKQESLELAKRGYEVRVFSTNFEKGTDKIVCEEENFNGIKIIRFPAKKLGGESFMNWNFEKQALLYAPDIIIVHVYRHLHTTKALKIKKILGRQGKKCKVFLVTHAPFARNSTRTFIQNKIVKIYDEIIGRTTIKKFDKIIAITKWEIPYLLRLGCRKERIIYIPNGIPEEFFKLKNKTKEENKILFLGRISPIKNLETAIKSMQNLNDKKISLEFVGPVEEKYLLELKELIKKIKLEKRIDFSPAIYNLRKKISKLDSCKIFILPSKTEGMPQSLIEAMAREKIVLGSNIPAIQDLITEGKNGYLFKQGDSLNLANKMNFILSKNNSRIQIEARASVRQFSWHKIIKKTISLF